MLSPMNYIIVREKQHAYWRRTVRPRESYEIRIFDRTERES